MALDVFLLPALKDNYIAVAYESESAAVAVIDPSEAVPIIRFLEKRGWHPQLILNTHHHWDHTGGNEELIERYDCPLFASAIDGEKIEGVTDFISDGDCILFGAERFQALSIPGHTLGHTAFFAERNHVVFTGDTLFSLGCGRLFEGTPQQMWASLSKLADLPDDTRVYCGHEYTQANARFAREVEPDNRDLIAREEEVQHLRAAGQPTLPSTISLEKRTNPFLRANFPTIRARLKSQFDLADTAPDWQAFAHLREWKDRF